MSITANDMIARSMRLVGALGQGETPTAQEQTDGLYALNAMLDSWSIERLMVYNIVEENFTWTASSRTQTMGSGGNFNTTRPSKLENGFSRVNNVDYPYELVSKPTYDLVVAKSTVTSTFPRIIYADYGFPLITLSAYPIPVSALDFHLNSWKQLQSFATGTTALSLPPGYQRAMEYNLAVEMSTDFSLPVPGNVAAIAVQSKANIKRLNKVSMVANLDAAIVKESRYNIYSD